MLAQYWSQIYNYIIYRDDDDRCSLYCCKYIIILYMYIIDDDDRCQGYIGRKYIITLYI